MRKAVVLWCLSLGYSSHLIAGQIELPTRYTHGEKDFSGIVKVVEKGGLCAYGTCYSAISVDQEGNYEWVDGRRNIKAEGNLGQKKLNELIQQIQKTDFASVKSKEFKGNCPSDLDGMETIYIFRLTDKMEVIPACVYAIDMKLALFVSVNNLVTQIYRSKPNKSLKPTAPREP